jgi:hypothetical protein
MLISLPLLLLQALVLHLLCERAAGADSFWAPYITVLGDQATHPLLWNEQLQQQLAGSSMLRTLQTRLQQVQEVRLADLGSAAHPCRGRGGREAAAGTVAEGDHAGQKRLQQVQEGTGIAR